MAVFSPIHGGSAAISPADCSKLALLARSGDRNPNSARDKIERRAGHGESTEWLSGVPFTPEAKTVLAYTVEEADRLQDERIRTGHLLLGLFRTKNESCARLLRDAGIALEPLRTAVRDAVRRNELRARQQEEARVRALCKRAELEARRRAARATNRPSGLERYFSPEVRKALQSAQDASRAAGFAEPGTLDALLGIIDTSPKMVALLRRSGLDSVQRLHNQIARRRNATDLNEPQRLWDALANAVHWRIPTQTRFQLEQLLLAMIRVPGNCAAEALRHSGVDLGLAASVMGAPRTEPVASLRQEVWRLRARVKRLERYVTKLEQGSV